MQLPRGRRRQIQQSSRPEGLLAYARLSDPILVKRAKDGDTRAFEALCERHAPRVEKLAGHLLRDPEDARDAAQEALAKLCVNIRQFRGESQFATWLHRLTINACRDVGNRQRARACEPLLEDRRAATDADPAREADRARASPRRRPQGRAWAFIRGDLHCRRHARGNGEVLRASRPQPVARQAFGRCMTFARLRLARAPFFGDRLSSRAAEIAACAEEIQRGNRPVPPESPLPSHGPEAGP